MFNPARLHPLKLAAIALLALAPCVPLNADDGALLAPLAEVPGAVFGPVTYERTSGPPDTFSDHFNVPLAGGYVFWLKNGDTNEAGDPEGRVSSGSVTINGVVVVAPNDLNENISRIQKPVYLVSGDNVIDVQVNGRPGDYFTVAISKTPVELSVGRLILPWINAESGNGVRIALKSGSHRHNRLVRALFFHPDGTFAGKSPRILLPAHGARMMDLAQLAEGLNFSRGSVEFIWAGHGPERLFGYAEVHNLAVGSISVIHLNQAGNHRRRKNIPAS